MNHLELEANRMSRPWLRPGAFCAGVAGSFILCCVVGQRAPEWFPFRDFVRFHDFIEPESQYLPTALQLRALVRQHVPRDKIAVVIGGDSILQGIGQPVEQLWSRRLQELLGSDYRVLNLAIRGGAPNEYGQVAAEMLYHEGRRVLYLCDAWIHTYAAAPDGTRPAYRYIFHDARARGLLLDHPERDAALTALEPRRRAEEAFAERAFRSRANAWLAFDDLWHVVGYEAGMTVWTPRTSKHPWQPRRLWREVPLHTAAYRAGITAYRDIVRSHCQPKSADYWHGFEETVRHATPLPLRPRMLVVVPRCNPAVLDQLSAEDPQAREKYGRELQTTLRHLRACGLNAVDGCATCSAEDYLDGNHLLPSGGEKLAEQLAPLVRSLAQGLFGDITP
ncbi:MAG: hypothetical protein NZO58_07370 [Gemmataceae bacterium]|nr:hypothetical protein [Gemmataceae bacterium]